MVVAEKFIRSVVEKLQNIQCTQMVENGRRVDGDVISQEKQNIHTFSEKQVSTLTAFLLRQI
jgi:hypothetical protein